jgi:hypothetical protein
VRIGLVCSDAKRTSEEVEASQSWRRLVVASHNLQDVLLPRP